ncbi:MAG TPA: hypothetical protein VFA27_13270 [Vicinamibacterales bacterium]|nr:hypothetical protein [Vicinamibacterales bacterium]
MMHAFRTYCCVAALLLAAVPASAQYRPRPLNDPATGENYHIEGSVGLWFPSADLTVASSGSGFLSGIGGTSISAENDLGMPSSTHLPDFELVLRPARRHKLRASYIPIQFTGSATLTRDITFNGQKYQIGVPVDSTLTWHAARFNYEFDFVDNNRGFGGFIVEAKYTDVRVELDAPTFGLAEFARAQAPIPALGGIARVYVVPNVAITGEVTAFKLPTIEDKYAGHYVDVDIYATLNFTNNIGVKGGFRSLNLGYLIKQDTGDFTMNGVYFAAVLRY